MIKPQIRSLFILLISTSTSTLFIFFFFIFNTHFTICLGISESGSNSFVTATSELDAIFSRCSRNTSECTEIGMELIRESESIKMRRRRRVLMIDDYESRYISYATLKRDLVPCRRPGASYYNCRAVEDEANPYTRGCEIIAGCARTISGDDIQT